MPTVTISAYHVKRFVSGATGTNTINIYSPLGFEAKSEIEPLASLAAAVEVEHAEAAFGVDLEPTQELVPDMAVAETSLEAHVAATPEPRLALASGLRIDLEPRGDEIEAKAMAEAMKDAARLGLPFCEECTRARLRLGKAAPKPQDDVDAHAMAEAMKDAARRGVPFCEECTRARLRLAKEAPSPRPEPAPAEDDIDAEAMAKAMQEAARSGVAFCAECTRARLKQEREKRPK